MYTERLKRLKPYVPGEQPSDKKYIKLNTNESPYPPSPEINNLIKKADIQDLRLYPNTDSSIVKKALSDLYEINEECIFVSNGSDEVLSFIFYGFFDSKTAPLLFPEFTYSFYPVYCDFYNIEYKKIPLKKDFGINLADYLSQESCGIIFPNPNAPTGKALSFKEIESFLSKYDNEKLVVIDEAYVDFGADTAVKLINKYNNLLIVQTLSKSRALAGIRLGFAMGSTEIIKGLDAIKNSFNSYPVDRLAQKIAETSIRDEKYFRKTVDQIIKTRESFSIKLKESGWTVLDSKANFVFAKKDGISGKKIYQDLKDKGILVRNFNIKGIEDFLRITIGKDKDMQKLLEELKKY